MLTQCDSHQTHSWGLQGGSCYTDETKIQTSSLYVDFCLTLNTNLIFAHILLWNILKYIFILISYVWITINNEYLWIVNGLLVAKIAQHLLKTKITICAKKCALAGPLRCQPLFLACMLQVIVIQKHLWNIEFLTVKFLKWTASICVEISSYHISDHLGNIFYKSLSDFHGWRQCWCHCYSIIILPLV